MKPVLLSLVTSIILPFLADAMPTAEEQEKVRPLVQGLMKPDLDAMKQGKKSRSDVAKSAMDLYSKADSPAAKMLLARNALNLYAKAGEYEAAESALDALLAAVPDYPAPDVAELLEKSLHPLPNRAAPNLRARLAAVKDKAQAASQLKKLLPVYGTLAEGPKRKACAARIASAYVALDDWPNANKYFAVSDSPAAAAASAELKLQDEPEASRPYDKPADAWWSVELPKKDAKLSSAIHSHAAALYAKAIPSLKGLAKVQAERRIQEVKESAAAESSSEPRVASYGSKKNPYVTKGLVAMWDGEWNAGLGKHDAKASKWKDVVGKSDCDPVGAPKFSANSVELDGNSCWKINPSPELLKVVLSPSVTCEVVLKFGKGATAANEGFIGFGKSNSRALWGYAGGAPMSASASIAFQHRGSPPPASWKSDSKVEGLHTMVISVNNAEVLGLIDGKQCVKTKSGAATNPDPCFIGNIDGHGKMVGEIFCVRIYNRALDERELQSNHSIDKKRFQ